MCEMFGRRSLSSCVPLFDIQCQPYGTYAKMGISILLRPLPSRFLSIASEFCITWTLWVMRNKEKVDKGRKKSDRLYQHTDRSFANLELQNSVLADLQIFGLFDY